MAHAENDPWSWETDGNVLVCDQRGWNEGTEAEIQRLMGQFEELASRDSVSASVTLLDPDIDLSAERQAAIEQSAPLYDELGVHRQALVSDGIAGMALASLVDLPDGFEIETFDDRETAMDWART